MVRPPTAKVARRKQGTRAACALIVVFSAVVCAPLSALASEYVNAVRPQLPSVALSGVPFDASFSPQGVALPASGRLHYRVICLDCGPRRRVLVNSVVEVSDAARFRGDDIRLDGIVISGTGQRTLQIALGDLPPRRATLQVIPGWLTLLPPILTIILAFALRNVLAALAAGVLLSAAMIEGFNPIMGCVRALHVYLIGSFADSNRVKATFAFIFLGAAVGVIGRAGGIRGLARLTFRGTRTRRRGLLATWFFGLVIFVDDYASTLFVGPAMRTITDRLFISREKLAFIIDATAAPVVSLAVLSSWTALEVSGLEIPLEELGLEINPFALITDSLFFRFYPLFLLVFAFFVILFSRDFGPMLKAERRALRGLGRTAVPTEFDTLAGIADSPSISTAKKERRNWVQFIFPIATLVISALAVIAIDGRAKLQSQLDAVIDTKQMAEQQLERAHSDGDAAAAVHASTRVDEARMRLFQLEPNIRNVLRHADTALVLFWSCLLTALVAAVIACFRRVIPLEEVAQAALEGTKTILPTVGILVFAWALSDAYQDLRTADFVIEMLGNHVPTWLLPAFVFVIAAATSFGTGASLGTMAILFPVVVPLSISLSDGSLSQLPHVIGALLAGAVWGDHCSPVSDTTILSSLTSGCDHRDHAITQLPYAALVGLVALLLGHIPVGAGLYPTWVAMLLGIGTLLIAVRQLGKPAFRTSPHG